MPPSIEGESSSSARDRDESAHTAARIPGPVAQQRCVLASWLFVYIVCSGVRLLMGENYVLDKMSLVDVRDNSAPV